MYEVGFSKKAEKQFDKLPLTIQGRVIDNLERIRIRPYSFVKRLIGTSYFRLRVGDYRIILDIRNRKLIIMVVELGHKKNIYN